MNRIPWYIIIALTLYIVFLRACNKCPEVAPKEIVTTIIKHDTQTITAYEPMPVLTIRDTVTREVDTVAIVQDYLSKRIYNDTLRSKYGFVVVIDTIYQNRISDRKVSFDFSVPEVHITTAPRNQVYFGLNLGGSKDFISFGPSLFLKTKTDKIYSINASYTSQSRLYYNIGAAWKIHF